MSIKKILVAVPAYNCERQISRVISQFLSAKFRFEELLIIDNCSTDQTLNIAKAKLSLVNDSRIRLIQNSKNYGLGGSHKIAFNYCQNRKYDGVVILHGDDQGRLSDFENLIKHGLDNFDCYLGARFMKESRLLGYSNLRIAGNKIFNLLFSLCTSRRVFDMGSGLNYYNSNLFNDSSFMELPDDLTFNNAHLLFLIWQNKRIKFFPISWREEDQISNAKLYSQFIKIVKHLIYYSYARMTKKSLRLTYNFLPANYTYKIIK
jgi:glycosyltransferase involved in cell wall biosynthesis